MPEPGDVRRWLIPALVVIGLLLFFGLGSCNGPGEIVGAVYGSGTTPETPVPATQRVRGPAATEVANTAGSGTVMTVHGLMLPLSSEVGTGGSLDMFAGDRAVATRVQVLSVDADEGFWIGTGRNDRIWVQLVGPPPESPYHVQKGDTVSFNAAVVEHSARFARQVGVDRSEGSQLLTAQGQHLAARKTKLKLYRYNHRQN